MKKERDKSVEKQIQHIEALIGQIEQSSDPEVQSAAREMVGVLLEMHGAGLARMIELLGKGEGGRDVLQAFAADELVGGLLLLHGLHPTGLEDRVRGALDKVRPRLATHRGDVELLGVSEGIVRLRLQGSCNGCPSSRFTLQMMIEKAIYTAAPDVAAIEVEGLAEPAAPSAQPEITCPTASA